MKRAPKVAYILLHFPYLTETFVAEEIQALQTSGVDVQIISLLDAGPGPVQSVSQRLLLHTWYAPGIDAFALWRAQFHYLRRSPGIYLSSLLKLLRQPYKARPPVSFLKRLMTFLKAVAVARHLEGSDLQVLHSHFAWLSGAATWICARLLDLPYTVTVHAFDIYSQKNDLLCLICEEASHVITISDYNRQQIRSLCGCQLNTISVIHCGVNLESFQEQSQTVAERANGSQLKILSVGSLVTKKGHRHLIAACHVLKVQGLDFDCSIIGGGPDEAALRQQIQANGLQEQVRLLGPLSHSDIMAAYQQHDLFVLASVVAPDGDRDGIPVVLMEAGALGKPLLSTQVSGIPELVIDGQTGMLVPPGDAIALAKAIMIMANDPTLQSTLGSNARELVQAKFNIEGCVQELSRIFHSIKRKYENLEAGNGNKPVKQLT